MKRTLAELQKKWYGFYATRYTLDLTFLDGQLTQPFYVDSKLEHVPIKVGEVYKALDSTSPILSISRNLRQCKP